MTRSTRLILAKCISSAIATLRLRQASFSASSATVQADLVAELHAVGHRLGGAVHPDGDTMVGYGLDAVAVALPRRRVMRRVG